MTLQEAVNKLLDTARRELNYREGYNNYIKYAQNNWDNQFYGWELQNQPWCDVFVDWCFCETFGLQTGAAMTYQTVGSGSALCSASASFYEKNNAFYNYPQPGDQVFFFSNGDINHTGLVESVVGSGANWTSFTTIEGNSNDQVARRTYNRGNNKVAGFGRPKWSLVAQGGTIQNPPAQQQKNKNQPTITTPTPSQKYQPHIYNIKINLLKKEDYGPQVSSMQALLNAKGFKCKVNGKFDNNTFNVLKDFQTKAGIEVDGEFGQEAFTALWNYS